jgi:hypothetical protein
LSKVSTITGCGVVIPCLALLELLLRLRIQYSP